MSNLSNGETDIIEIKKLNIVYHKGKPYQFRALENINLSIKAREWVIIFGPSGCGKSTLLSSIASLETPTSGVVKVSGIDINKLNSFEKSIFRQKKVGMVFQSFHLINSLNIFQNVCLPKIFSGESFKRRAKLAEDFLVRFGIFDQKNKYPRHLSGGQKQKVSIARALMNSPEIILADEPTGNLDSKSSYNVMTILQELNEIDKKTIIMVTHSSDYLEYADRVVFMQDGKIIKTEVRKKKKKFKTSKGEDESNMVETKEKIPRDLQLLMKSYKDLSSSSFGKLLEPFKVRQVFSYLTLSLNDHQIEVTKEKMKQFFLGNLSKKKLIEELDKEEEKGGAGWNKISAIKFANEIDNLNRQSQKIDYSEVLKSAMKLADYFIKKYYLKYDEYEFNVLKNSISERLSNQYSADELKDILDRSKTKNGLGLDKRLAEKIVQELELLILIRY